jgi:hypothetical protein
MEGDIHCLLGWVGAFARPSPAIFRNYRSVNPGITMIALGQLPPPPLAPTIRWRQECADSGRKSALPFDGDYVPKAASPRSAPKGQ